MINEKENIKISKFISLVLRHKPGTIDLTIDENGWAATLELIEKMNTHGFHITQELLNHIVQTNNKKRFSFNESKNKIRACPGHSIEVELELKETEPPSCLYHGTGEKHISSILNTGLKKMNRLHVHLSSDKETAILVGQRHGKPKVFMVAAGEMSADGFLFYISANNVWLTHSVPEKYLKLVEEE